MFVKLVCVSIISLVFFINEELIENARLQDVCARQHLCMRIYAKLLTMSVLIAGMFELEIANACGRFASVTQHCVFVLRLLQLTDEYQASIKCSSNNLAIYI